MARARAATASAAAGAIAKHAGGPLIGPQPWQIKSRSVHPERLFSCCAQHFSAASAAHAHQQIGRRAEYRRPQHDRDCRQRRLEMQAACGVLHSDFIARGKLPEDSHVILPFIVVRLLDFLTA
jgi:hypothetical protein